MVNVRPAPRPGPAGQPPLASPAVRFVIPEGPAFERSILTKRLYIPDIIRDLIPGIIAACLLAILVLLQSSEQRAVLAQQGACRSFKETGQSVCGRFLQYWSEHGDLPQQGYPISGEISEKSDIDGKVYVVQYFERAVFEAHTENSAPNDVLLSLLGTLSYNGKYAGGAPGQVANNASRSQLFQQTGHRVGGKFLDYWQSHGGVAQQGYPISEEFQERSDLDGKLHTVQYFERAVMELHPENLAPYDVLLSLLGTLSYRQKHPQVQGSAGGQHSISTVFLIVMENHNWSDIKGSSSAPYINSVLLAQGSYAEQYYNPPGTHPSEPNYLWLEAGSAFGISNDKEPSANHQATENHSSRC